MKRDLNQAINERAMALNWVKETERFLIRSITNKHLVRTMKLRNSVTSQALGLLSEVKTFIFKYSLHGMFVDMGVFGGKSLEQNQEAAFIRRLTGKRGKKGKRKSLSKRQYRWYSRTIYGAVNKLGDRMLEVYGFKADNAFRLPEIIEM
jgi:hypothetical protein